MNRFFPGSQDDSDDLAALDPRAHPVAPPRMAGAVKILVGAEADALAAPRVNTAPAAKIAATEAVDAVPARSEQSEEIEVMEPVPERIYRVGVIEALKGKRLQLSPSQRAAAAAAGKLPAKDS